MGRNLIIPGGTRTIDATGKLVIPGGIDPHTHLDLEMMGAKTVDNFYSGTKAAIAGGTTMISEWNIFLKLYLNNFKFIFINIFQLNFS